MRKHSHLIASAVILAAALLGGCSGEKQTPEDDAFQKQFAEAAAQQKGQPIPTRGATAPKLDGQ